MRVIKLKCELDQANYDQTVREVIVESEDEKNWYGRPLANPACLSLQWPKFAWKEVEEDEARKALTRSPSPGTNHSPAKGERIDATKP